MTVELATGSDPALLREIDGISAVLANHLAYEERVIVDLLDHLPVEPGSDDEAAILAPLDGIFDER